MFVLIRARYGTLPEYHWLPEMNYLWRRLEALDELEDVYLHHAK